MRKPTTTSGIPLQKCLVDDAIKAFENFIRYASSQDAGHAAYQANVAQALLNLKYKDYQNRASLGVKN